MNGAPATEVIYRQSVDGSVGCALASVFCVAQVKMCFRSLKQQPYVKHWCPPNAHSAADIELIGDVVRIVLLDYRGVKYLFSETTHLPT